jgi:hypothetical protein
LGIKLGDQTLTDRYPDAVNVVEVPQKQLARQLAHLHLCAADLRLAELSLTHWENSQETNVRAIFWRSAVLHWYKCFDSDARGQLPYKKIYSKYPHALWYYEYFKNLRNFHVVHDLNSYSQFHVVAVLSQTTVLGVEVLTITAAEHARNYVEGLKNLIAAALQYIDAQSLKVTELIRAGLEATPIAQLHAMPNPTFTLGSPNDITKPRS